MTRERPGSPWRLRRGDGDLTFVCTTTQAIFTATAKVISRNAETAGLFVGPSMNAYFSDLDGDGD